MVSPRLFVAATRQHVGKTTVSLSIMSELQRRFNNVGFIKPVGQQHITVSEGGKEIVVDKDVQVMKEFFNLDHLRYEHSVPPSPLILPSTRASEAVCELVCAEPGHHPKRLHQALH